MPDLVLLNVSLQTTVFEFSNLFLISE